MNFNPLHLVWKTDLTVVVGIVMISSSINNKIGKRQTNLMSNLNLMMEIWGCTEGIEVSICIELVHRGALNTRAWNNGEVTRRDGILSEVIGNLGRRRFLIRGTPILISTKLLWSFGPHPLVHHRYLPNHQASYWSQNPSECFRQWSILARELSDGYDSFLKYRYGCFISILYAIARGGLAPSISSKKSPKLTQKPSKQYY